MIEKLKKRLCAIAYLVCVVLLYSVCFIKLSENAKASAKYITAASQTNKKTVILDAGHGGEDSGAIGSDNVYEKDLNLEITFKLGEYLSAAGYNVVYTRTEDKLLYTEEQNIKGMRKINDLKNRMKIANSYDDAIFVSIHMNSYGAAECSGLQVYYGVESEKSRALAEKVQSETVKRIQQNNKRKVKSGNGIYLLENSINPAILIECGFLSNPEECKKLSEKEYQKELSFSILCGIIEYIKE
ncbi:MAG: cell wall hydrolase [Ruminococcaceae bacterium]|nr:cell wall hydrolase [Oscillospiraceae bacterium]